MGWKGRDAHVRIVFERRCTYAEGMRQEAGKRGWLGERAAMPGHQPNSMVCPHPVPLFPSCPSVPQCMHTSWHVSCHGSVWQTRLKTESLPCHVFTAMCGVWGGGGSKVNHAWHGTAAMPECTCPAQTPAGISFAMPARAARQLQEVCNVCRRCVRVHNKVPSSSIVFFLLPPPQQCHAVLSTGSTHIKTVPAPPDHMPDRRVRRCVLSSLQTSRGGSCTPMPSYNAAETAWQGRRRESKQQP